MKTILLPLIAAMTLCACAKVPEKVSEKPSETPQENPWTEITADAVSFVRMHPDAAQKNVYATWKHYQNAENKSWKLNKEEVAVQAELDALFDAANADLIPSDKLYACRYRENMPQYRLNFRHDDKNYAIVSSSGCQAGTPWNVLIDGKSYIQMTGAIGIALENLLKASGMPVAIGDTAAMIMFAETAEIDGYHASGPHPAKWYDAEFRKDPTFGGALQYIENAIGPVDLPEIACNQAKSKDCKAVSARYTLKFATDCEYLIPLKYDGTVTASIPPQTAFESLAKALKSPVMAAWPKATPRTEPVRFVYDTPDDCKMVRGIAKHFDKPDNTTCESWKITSKDFPSAILYTGLGALWIEPEKDYKPYFDIVRQIQADSKQKKISYGAFANPGKSTNQFVRLDGRPIAFVTKDGKTTINQ